jgi:hypothetical protein
VSAPTPPHVAPLGVSPAFKWTFGTLVALTLVIAVAAVVLSFVYPTPTATESSAISWLFASAAATLGGLLGMVAGKIT